MLLNSIRQLQGGGGTAGPLPALAALAGAGGGGQGVDANGLPIGMYGLQQYGQYGQQIGAGYSGGDDDRRKPGRPVRQAPPGAKGMCHVEGCGADLSNLKEYHLRYKICEYHLKAPSILKEGQNQRFCQQVCGMLAIMAPAIDL